jgi:hypothetical protein
MRLIRRGDTLNGRPMTVQDRLDQFNHDRKIEVDGRILELAS